MVVPTRNQQIKLCQLMELRLDLIRQDAVQSVFNQSFIQFCALIENNISFDNSMCITGMEFFCIYCLNGVICFNAGSDSGLPAAVLPNLVTG